MNDNIKSLISLCLAIYIISFATKPFTEYVLSFKSPEKVVSSVTLIKGCDSVIVLTDVITYVPVNVLFEIKDFRPFVQDIVKSYYKHSDDLVQETYTFCGKGFCLWTGNGPSALSLYTPKKVEFTNVERAYLWKLYRSWSPNVEIEY